MPRTKVVIVYSERLARRLRVTVPDASDPDDWDDVRAPRLAADLRPGEKALVIPLGLYRLLGPDEALQRVLGRPPQSDVHAVVDPGGKVVSFIHIDPAIHRSPFPAEYTLVADPNRRTKVGSLIHRLVL